MSFVLVKLIVGFTAGIVSSLFVIWIVLKLLNGIIHEFSRFVI